MTKIYYILSHLFIHLYLLLVLQQNKLHTFKR